jgi:hypothetical protein
MVGTKMEIRLDVIGLNQKIVNNPPNDHSKI